jgi:catechol 2,3-dioxygenase
MHVHALGHVVLKVQSLERSERFYAGLLGLTVCARLTEPLHMTFFTLGNHHDFALMEVGDDATQPAPQATGLAHVAFKVGDSLEELRATKAQLRQAGVDIAYEMDHTITQSLYLHDPDDNEVELYVDSADTWTTDPMSVATAELVEF